jgi:tetratricopeptide (TPR) repeat protein
MRALAFMLSSVPKEAVSRRHRLRDSVISAAEATSSRLSGTGPWQSSVMAVVVELDLSESRAWSEAALMRYQQLVAEHPDSEEATRAIFYVGWVMLDLERDDEAVEWLQQAVWRHPQSSAANDARLLIAENHLEWSRFEAARDGYRELLGRRYFRYEPYVGYKAPSWMLSIATAHHKQGLVEEARASLAALEAMVAPDSAWSRGRDLPARAAEGAQVLSRAKRRLGEL